MICVYVSLQRQDTGATHYLRLVVHVRREAEPSCQSGRPSGCIGAKLIRNNLQDKLHSKRRFAVFLCASLTSFSRTHHLVSLSHSLTAPFTLLRVSSAFDFCFPSTSFLSYFSAAALHTMTGSHGESVASSEAAAAAAAAHLPLLTYTHVLLILLRKPSPAIH